MIDTRRKVLFGIAGLAVAAVLAVGGYLLFQKNADPYAGLTLWRETQIDDATRVLLEQRVATTRASIASQQTGESTEMTGLYLALANDTYILGDLVSAREALEEVLNRNPLMHVAWNSYGNVLARMEDIVPAENAYLQAIEISPSADYYLGYVRFLQKYYPERDSEVLTVLEHGVSLVGQQPELMVALAEWHAKQGNCDKAISHYKVAVTLAPENTAIADDLAMVRTTCVNAAE